MRAQPLRTAACALALALAGPAVLAQSVALTGMLGNRALLVVDGKPPRAAAPGDTVQGVKVLSTAGDQAVVEIGGKKATLRIGDAPVSVGGPAGGGGTRITLMTGAGGHFTANGAINGQSVNFIVDTGASVVSIGMADAQRLGLNYQAGQPVRMATANGVVQGWRMSLRSVKLGDVTLYDVDAVVTPLNMPYVLLGNSFLNRFQMRRDADMMVLERRY